MNFKNNKAFTIIELIVVIAVIGILVLLAAPKLLGYTEDAKLAQIKNDVKVMEAYVGEQIVKAELNGEDYFEIIADSKLTEEQISTLQSNVDSGDVYDVKGEVSELVGEEFYKVDSSNIKTKLKGDFYTNEEGKVYYYGAEISGGFVDNNEDFEWVEDSYYGYEATNEEGKGYYRYIGTGKSVVEIPHVINGHEMTNYNKMFYESGEDVEKVISTNTNVTDMSYMFQGVLTEKLDLSNFNTENVTSIDYMFSGPGGAILDGVDDLSHIKIVTGIESWDLSSLTSLEHVFRHSAIPNTPSIVKSWGDAGHLDNVTSYRGLFNTGGFKDDFIASDVFANVDTSKVTDMSQMFYRFQANTLDLSSFDTSNVTDMSDMFASSRATSITFGESFDTSNVTDMSSMFHRAEANTLDLSNFNTSNVTSMRSMFYESEAITLDLSSFDTSNVTNMMTMFYKSKAATLDLSSFDMKNVDHMSYMLNQSHAKKGFARTEYELNKLNSSTSKPRNLTFVLKDQ